MTQWRITYSTPQVSAGQSSSCPDYLWSFLAWRQHLTDKYFWDRFQIAPSVKGKPVENWTHADVVAAFHWRRGTKRPNHMCPQCLDDKRVKYPLIRVDENKKIIQTDEINELWCLCTVIDWLRRKRKEMSEVQSKFILSQFKGFDVTGGETATEETRKALFTAHKHSQEFTINPKHWLILAGPYGIGKSNLARCVASNMPCALYLRAADFKDMIFDGISNHALSEIKRLIQNAPVLVLDDLHTDMMTPILADNLKDILDWRYGDGQHLYLKPVMLTTNITEFEFHDKWNALGDRLTDQQNNFLWLNAQSYRQVPTDKRGSYGNQI